MPAGRDLTINFDNHITKVVLNDSFNEWTTSGQTQNVFISTKAFGCDVSLESGYVLDTVIPDRGEVSSKTDNSFSISNADVTGAITVTLTSKLNDGGRY